ncbi:hypothetical protein BH24ACI1_BH24ACI1_19050 [soil metagenome]|jgi:hypothetical protein|nr:hypothetical protein [Pyrinomonadaceae bacterium]
MLTAIETTATISANRQLTLDEDLPETISAGKVRVIVLFSEEDFDDREWLKAASKNDAFDFLNDEAEDIYTLEDGKPLTK